MTCFQETLCNHFNGWNSFRYIKLPSVYSKTGTFSLVSFCTLNIASWAIARISFLGPFFLSSWHKHCIKKLPSVRCRQALKFYIYEINKKSAVYVTSLIIYNIWIIMTRNSYHLYLNSWLKYEIPWFFGSCRWCILLQIWVSWDIKMINVFMM